MTAVDYLLSKMPRVPSNLNDTHPIVLCLLTKKFDLALKILNLMEGEIEPSDDGMTILHHLFVNYDGSDECNLILNQVLTRNSSSTRTLTLYGESALDLAIEHKTQAVQFALANKSFFDFNLNTNSSGLSLLHRAVLCNNFPTIM